MPWRRCWDIQGKPGCIGSGVGLHGRYCLVGPSSVACQDSPRGGDWFGGERWLVPLSMAHSIALVMRALWGDVRTTTANASEAMCSLCLVNSLMDCLMMHPTTSWELMEAGDSE